MSALLEVQRVTMRFGGLTAVDDASMAVPEGAITGLIGPNGAGKTTLFAVVSGFLAPTAGRVRYRGDDITGLSVHARAGRGIARTFQVVQPFAGLSVRENIAVGAYLRHATRDDALAAAGAVAARHLAPASVDTAGVIGTGTQARLQMEAAHLARPFRKVLVWGRDDARARGCAADLGARLGIPAEAVADPARLGELHLYRGVERWRSIFDEEPAARIAPYRGRCP